MNLLVPQEAQPFVDEASSIPSYLQNYKGAVVSEKIQQIRVRRAASLMHAKYAPLGNALTALPQVKASFLDLKSDVVTIGRESELSDSQQESLHTALRAFMPWKKGPFDIFGQLIDAEWRSDLKWQRLLPAVEPLTNLRVADIGCNNGYYMLRMAGYQPELVIGFEPYAKYWYNFQLLNRLAQVPELFFELLGVEHIDLYPKFFDAIFCLGILYHHTNPVGLLQKMRSALRYGGRLIIDCQGIVGDESMALVPAGRYAGARGVWFLPTYSCLCNWLKRADFKLVNLIWSGPLTTEEQRATAWAPITSLGDFLDPADPSKTVEGYPAPQRFYLVASPGIVR